MLGRAVIVASRHRGTAPGVAGERLRDKGGADANGVDLIQQTEVTDNGLAALQSLSKLKQLNLKVTFVTEKGAKALQAALPECEIEY